MIFNNSNIYNDFIMAMLTLDKKSILECLQSPYLEDHLNKTENSSDIDRILLKIVSRDFFLGEDFALYLLNHELLKPHIYVKGIFTESVESKNYNISCFLLETYYDEVIENPYFTTLIINSNNDKLIKIFINNPNIFSTKEFDSILTYFINFELYEYVNTLISSDEMNNANITKHDIVVLLDSLFKKKNNDFVNLGLKLIKVKLNSFSDLEEHSNNNAYPFILSKYKLLKIKNNVSNF
jgi:hypothetical protein